MKRYETFGDYMHSLLVSALKKTRQGLNQFRIFFQVVGPLFDDAKEDIFRVRLESMVMTCSEAMLPVHGEERQMPRLKGETEWNYRVRLSMKAIIAEKAGTKEGILLALTALGYDASTIQPYRELDPDLWAEFIVYLRGSEVSGVNDLATIHKEVMKVKQASSLPHYGVDSGNVVEIRSKLEAGRSRYPLCGTLLCGTWPEHTTLGHLVNLNAGARAVAAEGLHHYPMTGNLLAADHCYHRENVTAYTEYETITGPAGRVRDGDVIYPLPSEDTRTERSD